MSVDERLRIELERSFSPGAVDLEPELAEVRATHTHVRRRARVVRQLAVGVVLIAMFAGAGALAVWRGTSRDNANGEAVRYSSTAGVRFTPIPGAGADPRDLAMSPSTRAEALRAAGLAPAESSVTLTVTDASPTAISLAATAPSSTDARRLAKNWAAAFAATWRLQYQNAANAARTTLSKRVTGLHDRLRAVDRELTSIDPIHFPEAPFTYGWRDFNCPPKCTSTSTSTSTPSPPPLPDNVSRHELELTQERGRLIDEITALSAKAAQLRRQVVQVVVVSAPSAPTKVVERSHRSTETPIGIAAGGLLALLIASYAIYRFRMRPLSASRGIT